MQDMSFYSDLAPCLFMTYHFIYTQNQHLQVDCPVMRLLWWETVWWHWRSWQIYIFCVFFFPSFCPVHRQMNNLVNVSRFYVWKSTSQVDIKIEWACWFFGTAIFSQLCKFGGHELSTGLPERGAGQRCADGRASLIKESEEMYACLLRNRWFDSIYVYSNIKQKSPGHSAWSAKCQVSMTVFEMTRKQIGWSQGKRKHTMAQTVHVRPMCASFWFVCVYLEPSILMDKCRLILAYIFL